jgi:ketosteroid isomerase-like protein
VETVTRFVTSLSAGDVATCQSLVTDDLVFSEAPSLPFGGDWTGPDGLVGMLQAVSRDFRIRPDAPTVTEAGDRVLVRVTGTIGSRQTGATMPLEALDLYTLRDGQIARVDVYYKDAAAVSALCVAESASA